MEEKKQMKISMSGFFLILAIIVIAVMGYFIYKISTEKTEKENQIASLNNEISSLQSSSKDLQGKLDSIANTINNTSNNEKTNIVSKNTVKTENMINKKEAQYKNEYLKIVNEIEKENPDENITADLIYFNNDDIPDLVIGKSGYWVSLYIYENNQVYNLIDKWAYGAGGNTGYKYQDKKGIILNQNSDYAGAIITKALFIINSKNQFDKLIVTQKGIIDENTNPTEINNALEAYGGYFYNQNKISEQEYNNRLNELSINMDENRFKELIGSKTISEIKKLL